MGLQAMKPASQTTVAEHTTRHLTQHFAPASPEPIVLSEERPMELGPVRAGRYLAYDFQVPPHRELTFRVLVRGEVKITVNGEAVLDFRQSHLPGKNPPGGWHEGWHEATVWPDRFVNSSVRIGVENPMVESSDLVIEKVWVCSGAKMAWQPRSTPIAEARRVDGAFVPDGRLSHPAWETAPALELLKSSLADFKVASDIRFLFDDDHLYLGLTAEGTPLGHAPTGDSAEDERRIAAEMNVDELDPASLKTDTDIPGINEGYRPDVMHKEYLSLVIDVGADGRELVEFLVNSLGERGSTRYTHTGKDTLWTGSTSQAGKTQLSALKGSGVWSTDDFDPGSWRSWTEVGEEG